MVCLATVAYSLHGSATSEPSTQAESSCSSPRSSRSLCTLSCSEDGLSVETRTTVVFRNVPLAYTRDMVRQLLDEAGFLGCYDFIYQPTDYRTWMPFGYTFVNFTASEVAQRAMQHFQGFDAWKCEGGKPCTVLWSDPHQGLVANVEKYRNSPVMSCCVPDMYKPALFWAGLRVPFPEPTKKLKLPRVRRSSHSKLRGEMDRELATCDDF